MRHRAASRSAQLRSGRYRTPQSLERIAGKALNMLSMQTAPIAISSHPTEPAVPVLTSRAKDFITMRLARREPPERIAAGLRAYLDIEIAPAQVILFWRGELTLTPPTQTGHRQDDKESVQFPADAEKEPLFTVMAADEAAPAPFSIASDPDPACDGSDGESDGEDAQTTQTGHRQDEEESLQIPADTVDAPTSRDHALEALGVREGAARHRARSRPRS
jgi:hypothetical protein